MGRSSARHSAWAEMYGGIWVYAKLMAGLYRERWEHTIVYTKHTGGIILDATYGSTEFPIRVFVETARISAQSVITSAKEGLRPLIARIGELV